jgi:hypothetical protein
MRLSADDGPRSWEQRNVIPGSGLRSNVPKAPTHEKVGLNLTQKRDNYNAAGRMKNNGCSGLRKGFAKIFSPTTHYTIVRREAADC